MNVLVTGGAGFIGRAVVTQLLAQGHAVAVLDALLPAAHGPHAAVPDLGAARVVIGDVRDRAQVNDVLRGVDAVCHQAAMVGLGVDLADLPDYASVNVLGTAVLLAAMAEARVRRLVLASSMVVYGEGRYTCADHGDVRPRPRAFVDLDAGRFEPPCPRCSRPLAPGLVDEDRPHDPRSAYAATKSAQEHLTTAWAVGGAGTVAALRYHNVFGPGMPRDTPYAGVASIFRSALAAGTAPHVTEDGGQRRDFVHVSDIARANVLALTHPAPPAGLRAYNVGSGIPHTVGELAAELSAACDGPNPVVTGAYRAGDVRHITASSQRAADELGYRAQVPFRDGVREFAHAPLREPAAVRP